MIGSRPPAMPAHITLQEVARALGPSRTRDAFERGYYVEPPNGGLHAWIGRWFHRDPTAQLLMLGGIGTGKTTELLKAREALEGQGTAHAWYVTLEDYFDADAAAEGRLVTLAGLAMLALLLRKREPPVGHAHDLAVKLHGLLRPDVRVTSTLAIPIYRQHHGSAPPTAAGELARSIAPLAERLHPLRGARDGVTLLIDAFDRYDVDSFVAATRRDLPLLRDLGVGVAIVGNMAWRHGLDAEQRSLFHEVTLQPSWDPADASHLAFLCDVLDRRSTGALAATVTRALAVHSGGVMRDLVHLAQRSLYEAIDRGGTVVTPDDVTRALEAMRESRLAALDEESYRAFTALEEQGTEPTPVMCDRLHAQGCVLLRERHWVVHPAVRRAVERHEAA